MIDLSNVSIISRDSLKFARDKLKKVRDELRTADLEIVDWETKHVNWETKELNDSYLKSFNEIEKHRTYIFNAVNAINLMLKITR